MKFLALYVVAMATSVQSSLIQHQAGFDPDSTFPKLTKMGMKAWELSSKCTGNRGGGDIKPGTSGLACNAVSVIESACKPNGEQPLDYLAQAQCLCSPSSKFFAEWIACRRCLFDTSAISEDSMKQDLLRVTIALASMCYGTPTASFESYFNKAYTPAASIASLVKFASDQLPGNTAVSLYNSPTGSPSSNSKSETVPATTGSGSVTTTTQYGSTTTVTKSSCETPQQPETINTNTSTTVPPTDIPTDIPPAKAGAIGMAAAMPSIMALVLGLAILSL